MTENKMKEVAKLLGVEIREKFNTNATEFNPCYLTEKGLYDCDNDLRNDILPCLLTGEYEIRKPILDEVEKSYLEGVLKPFKKRINYIEKNNIISKSKREFIVVDLEDEEIIFPYFKPNIMYKGMKTGHKYTLEELRLFEED